jgi:hypothetical protein
MVEKMGKIVGNIVVILIITFFITHVYAGIRLEMRSADGVAHNNAVVGQPFLIEAIIDGVQGSIQAPHIEGLDKFVARRTGMYMSSINGVSTTKYTYQVRIDQPGTYTIGPAKLSYKQQELVSNSITAHIGNNSSSHIIKGPPKNSKKDQLKAFLRLIVDTDHVVVGQRINMTLRFYYQDPSIALANIGQPDIIGFDSKPAEKPTGGTIDIKGIHYKYAEWKWEIYPQKAGEFVIPAYSADYDIPLKNNHMLGSFFMFMNARADRKRVYSNAVKITVDPLPHYHRPVQAVGTFESLYAHITPPVAKEGEGMVFILELTGNGNMHAIEIPTLELPSTLKYYDSNTTIINGQNNDECAKKRFEFIVQGMECGDWQIPEQLFVYYDIERQDFVTLRTSSLSVSIQPSPLKTIKTYYHDDISKNNHDNIKTIAPLNVKGPWYPTSERTIIPWMLFYCMICLPMMCVMYPALYNWTMRFEYMRRRQRKKACKYTRRRIQTCMRLKEHTLIYTIFIDLFAYLTHQSASSLSRDNIEQYLGKLGFSEYDIQEWRIFFNDSMHIAYSKSYNYTEHELYRTAIQWLERIEQLV